MRPSTADSPEFALSYVRERPGAGPPVVVVPGGPGLGSILPYRALRRWAARRGLDLIMIEHRGIGRSRHDVRGRALPTSAMRIDAVVDDIAAVLDREAVDAAHLYGSSYGSYVVSGFGVRHPERVAGMILDSALQSTTDLALERRVLRELFWEADTETAAGIRALVSRGEPEQRLLDVVRSAHELVGGPLVTHLVRQRLARAPGLVWAALAAYAARDESIARIPGFYEFDIAGAIGFRELQYGAEPDGLPWDPALTYAGVAHHFPGFDGEPYDLTARVSDFTWPLVLLIGSRDLRTPPEIAHRVARLAPDAWSVELTNGHSALETHPAAALNAIRMLVDGAHDRLPGLAQRLDALPRRGVPARFAQALRALARAEAVIVPRAARG